jgi:hypothetical protein
LVLLAFGAAGCTGGAGWSKQGATAEDAQRDMVDCRRQAEAQAERESFGRGPAAAPVYDVDPNTGKLREQFATERRSADLQQSAQAQELTERCMLQRGYQRSR